MEVKPVIVVTGASRGLGAAIARWLGTAGAHVVLTARTPADLERTAAEIRPQGGEVLVLSGDMADLEFCRRLAQKSEAHFGRLDALVNNAALVEPLATVQEADPAAWVHNLAVGLAGPFYLTQAALPLLRKYGGRVVNVSSGAAQTALPGASAYCATKAALNHFTRVLAVEEPRVTCLAVRPGVVDTRMQQVLRTPGSGKLPEAQVAYYQQLKDDQRLEPPDVPGRAIAWLALEAPREWSGDFLNYDDPRIVAAANRRWGNGP
jgi:NAD(P)-dependent dehydrogenase (short-subunit alcohol dehydrogenase family)